MNFDFTKIKLSFGRLKARKYELGRKPELDWILALGGTVLFSIFLVAFSLYVYGAFQSGNSFEEIDAINISRPKVLDEKGLSFVLNHFSADSEVLNKLSVNPPNFVDPSK